MQWVVVEMGYVRDVCRWISVLDPASAAGMTVSFSSPSCSRRIATTGNSTLRAKWYSNHSSHWSLYIMHFPWFFGCFLTVTAGHQAWTRTSWQFWSGSANERARTLQEEMNRNCHLGMKSERSGHLLCQVTRNPKPWPCTKTIRWGGHMKNGKYWAYFWAISVWRAWECCGSEKNRWSLDPTSLLVVGHCGEMRSGSLPILVLLEGPRHPENLAVSQYQPWIILVVRVCTLLFVMCVCIYI